MEASSANGWTLLLVGPLCSTHCVKMFHTGPGWQEHCGGWWCWVMARYSALPSSRASRPAISAVELSGVINGPAVQPWLHRPDCPAQPAVTAANLTHPPADRQSHPPTGSQPSLSRPRAWRAKYLCRARLCKPVVGHLHVVRNVRSPQSAFRTTEDGGLEEVIVLTSKNK